MTSSTPLPGHVAQLGCPTGCLRRGSARELIGQPRSDRDVLACVSLRITFATAETCEGAPAGPRRGLDTFSRLTAGTLKVDSWLSHWTARPRETVAGPRSRLVRASSECETYSFGLRWHVCVVIRRRSDYWRSTIVDFLLNSSLFRTSMIRPFGCGLALEVSFWDLAGTIVGTVLVIEMRWYYKPARPPLGHVGSAR